MYGPEYLRKVGYNISGDPMVDQAAAGNLLTMNQSGAGIVILYAQGAPLDFVNVRDCVKLYADIQEHLRDWERVAQQGMHPDNAPPLEEFRMLEMVAMDIYRTAKFYEPDESKGDSVRDAIMAMNRRRNPVQTERYLRGQLTDSNGSLKPYVSIVDRIEHHLLGD
jgi:hypothetical protein